MRLQWWCARRRCCTDGQQQQQHRRCIAICATNAKWHPTYAQLVCHCRYTCSNMCEALVNHIFIQFNSFSFSLSLSVTVCVCFYISLYSLWPQKRISHRNLGIIRGMSCVCVSLLCDCVIISVCSTLYFFCFVFTLVQDVFVLLCRCAHHMHPIQSNTHTIVNSVRFFVSLFHFNLWRFAKNLYVRLHHSVADWETSHLHVLALVTVILYWTSARARTTK